eukprot:Partr_v1_DN27741_c0_g1_i1_m66865 putative NA
MTWARCALVDSESSLTEDEFRKRKAHPNFKWLIDLERSVAKLSSVKDVPADEEAPEPAIKTYVIAAGLIYHPYDGLFHAMLEEAWHGRASSCYGEGENIIPTIHLHDLSNIVVNAALTKPINKYIVAVDESKSTYNQIIKCISENLGTGQVNKVAWEEASLNKSIKSQELDFLKLNLRLEATSARDLTEFAYENGPVENIARLIEEYKICRDLEPVCILLHGPPLSGKTTLALQIAAEYNIVHLDLPKAVSLFLSKNEHDEELKQELKNFSKPSEQQLVAVQQVLCSYQCRNQGYVLDGFPETYAQAEVIFGEEAKPNLPNLIIELETNDETIKDRMDANVTEEAINKRIDTFRNAERSERAVLDYFDERDLFCVTLNSEKMPAAEIFAHIKKRVGHFGYSMSREELEAEKQKELAASKQILEAEREAAAKIEQELQAKMIETSEESKRKIIELKRQEALVLETRSAPLRKYLVDNILPVLTAALVEVSKVRPEDPIDFVAEYLFQHAEK